MTDGDRDDGGRAEGGEAETVLPLWPQREGPAPAGVGGIVSAAPPPFRHQCLSRRFLDGLDNRRSRLRGSGRMIIRRPVMMQKRGSCAVFLAKILYLQVRYQMI